MLREEKNLKDPERKLPASYGAGSSNMSVTVMSYTKTNKLVTALYMVTDIIDADEPLRNKLRTLGTEIISDINSAPSNIIGKISEIMSFLDIASAVNIISPMNCNILKKEFLELDQSIKESVGEVKNLNKQIDLSEFFQDSSSPFRGGFEERFLKNSPHPNPLLVKERGNLIPKGHTSIGVQRGGTLLKAIKDMSNKMPAPYEAEGFRSGSDKTRFMSNNDFDKLKNQRRDDILNIIKTIGGNATIKDIKDTAKNSPNKSNSLLSCGEKTLQRELVSMVKDGVLNKTGEKRWSRYFLVAPSP
ncbi:MAG: hypothetical protein PHT16_00125 [Candidatus Pacebacteria bacterium]|nr:hypothetical protein [Candidatus Paceibacterota bacterium]